VNSPSPREENSKRVKKTLKNIKNLLQNQQNKINQTLYKLFFGEGKSKFGFVLIEGLVLFKDE
jgi:signal transduction histidine kinase